MALPTRVLSTRVLLAVFAVFCEKLVVLGMYFSFGSLLPPLLAEFRAPQSATALVGSLAEAAFNFTCLFAGGFVERHGPVVGVAVGATCFCGGLLGDSLANHLFWWYAMHSLVGVGMGLTDMSAMHVIHRHTPVRVRGSCLGACSVGCGLGMAVVSAGLSVGCSTLGLRSTLQIMAVASAIAFSGLFYVARHLEQRQAVVRNEAANSTSGLHWLTCKEHRLFFAGLGLYATGVTVPVHFVKTVCLSKGLSAAEATYMPVLMGIGDAAGLSMFSSLGDVCGRYAAIFACMVFGSVLCLAAMPSCSSVGCFETLAVVYGAFSGGRAGLLSLVCLERFGKQHVIPAFGAASGMFLLSSLGPPAVGALYDASHSYSRGFQAAAGATALSLVCFLVSFSRASWHRDATL